MPFARALRDSLRIRERQVPSELANGDSLERVLNRDLLAVEEMAHGNVLTSILLLDHDGKTLRHAAAPNLPRSYCELIDGGEIGPRAGSCGTAAFLGEPVYVTDIASDPLWEDYRDIALPHGLRSCWSTPILGPEGAVMGTFAIYHRTAGSPTSEEIDAIAMITGHVAQAISCARNVQDLGERVGLHGQPHLRLVEDQQIPAFETEPSVGLLRSIERLLSYAEKLDGHADEVPSEEDAEALRTAAGDCRRLVSAIRSRIAAGERSEITKH
jgi:GAF domain-containing protein